MYLDVHTDSTGLVPALLDIDNFRDFKVVVHGGRDGLATALEGVGRLDDDGNAFLAIDAVRRLAGERAQDPEWRDSFAAMVEYARSKGWVDEAGEAIQAHCETAP